MERMPLVFGRQRRCKFLAAHPFHALLVVARLSDAQRKNLHPQLAELARDLKIQGGVEGLVRTSAEDFENLVTSK